VQSQKTSRLILILLFFSAECQSLASADRKGKGRVGRRPDIMFVMKHNGKKYKLIYIESSHLSYIL